MGEAFFSEWLATCPEITASPALGKIATRAGIFPDMPLVVRSPYQSGHDAHVETLRNLIQDRFPSLSN